MRTIKLYGELADKYGAEHRFDVANPLEAFAALFANFPTFRDDFEAGGQWALVAGDPAAGGRALRPSDLVMPISRRERELHILPSSYAVHGWELLIYAIIIIISVALSYALAPDAPTLDPNSREETANSYIFDGPVNVSEQGHPIPLVYGRVRVGSIVASSAITNTVTQWQQDFDWYSVYYGEGGYADMIDGGPYNSSYTYYPPVSYSSGHYDEEGNWIEDAGGYSSGGNTYGADELTSQATQRIVDLISEGEIGGLVGGLKGVYFDETPVQNADDSFNFDGVSIVQNIGTGLQAPLEGFENQSTPYVVATEVSVENGAVSRTVTNPDIDRVRMTIRLPALYEQDETTGDLKSRSVTVRMSVTPSGDSAIVAKEHTFRGITTGNLDQDFEFALPPGGAPWTLSVTRITADSTDLAISDTTIWQAYHEIIDAKFTYPHTAHMGVTIDAKQFGSRVPSRSYLVDGIKVLVPNNYNPVTREYTGVWDGTFTRAVCSNPVWVFYDLCSNDRYGLGRFMQALPNKFALYTVAQYCDELVDDGFGGTEPRYAMNGVLTTQEQALKVLRDVCEAFNSVVFGSSTTLAVVQDAPASTRRLVVPARTLSGAITYEGSDGSTLYSAAVVAFNDPEDGYRIGYEVVEDTENLQAYGWKPVDLTAFMCTSRGQAHRWGRWYMDNQRYRAAFCRYDAGPDHGLAAPGDIVEIADPKFTVDRWGGLIKARTNTSITIDHPVDIVTGRTYTLKMMLANGTVITRTLTNSPATGVTVLTWTGSVGSTRKDGVWALHDDVTANRKFRVVSVTEKRFGEYTIRGALYDPNKYARIEDGLAVEPANFTNIPTGPIVAPTGISVIEFFKEDGNSSIPCAHISWNPSTDPRAIGYDCDYRDPVTGEWRRLNGPGVMWRELVNVAQGDYKFRVRSIGNENRTGPWYTTSTVTLYGAATADGMPAITDLALVKNEDTATIELNWTRPDDVRPIYFEVYRGTTSTFSAATRIGITNDTHYRVGQTGHYFVRARYMSVFGTEDHLEVTTEDLLTLRSDIDLNSEEIAAEILRGAAWRAYADLQLFVDGQGVGTFAQQGLEEINTDVEQYAAWFTLLGAVNGANNAWVLDATTVQVTTDGSTATDFTTLVSTWNGHTAEISNLQTVIDGQAARWAVSLNVDGYITGLEAVNGGTPETSSFTIVSSNFAITDGSTEHTPFSITDGVVYMSDVVVDTVAANSITTENLVDNSVSLTVYERNDGGGVGVTFPPDNTHTPGTNVIGNYRDLLIKNFTKSSDNSILRIQVQMFIDHPGAITPGVKLILFKKLIGVDGSNVAVAYSHRDKLIRPDFGETHTFTWTIENVGGSFPAGTYTFNLIGGALHGSGGTTGTGTGNQVKVHWVETVIQEFKK